MSTADLLDAPVTERDWQQRAWERLRDVRAKRASWTLDDALAHPIVGRVVRGLAAQLRNDAAVFEAAQRKAERFGHPVTHNGFGYRRVRIGRPA